MIDSHCHLDQYPDPFAVAETAAHHGVAIVAVTSLPSHFAAGLSPARKLRRTRLALGMHPLHADQHEREFALFARLLGETSYVGEVGLDFSKHGLSSRGAQLRSFRFVLEQLRERPRFVSLHSRGAEPEVLDLLGEYGVGPTVFHWYSGSSALARKIAAGGHFFSVNPAMFASVRARQMIATLPRTAVLTESDGPYVRVGRRKVVPEDVIRVGADLAAIWGVTHEDAKNQLQANFRAAVGHLGREHESL